MIIWLTGQSRAGKTTLAKAFQKEWPCIILDGNEMRGSISLGVGFSRGDRAEHNFRVARLAKELNKQMNVVVSVIAPMRKVRQEISYMCYPDIMWVYVKRTLPEREGHFYEEGSYNIILDHDIMTIPESLKELRRQVGIEKKRYSLFIGRFSPLHNGHIALFDKVRAEGRNICVAIRNTEIDEDNPLSIRERVDLIEEQVPYAKVIIIPDIEEIVYGRRVGWGIREIRLDKEIEKISATDIRKSNRLSPTG